MGNVGFVLSHEQFPASELVKYGPAAEAAGFDRIWTSDHFHPWMDNQGHAGQAWITLAALGARTSNITFGTGVTCPTYRYHPSIVAQSFASLGVLYPGRVFLGVGTGEALNEKPASGNWGDYEERADRLIEAVQLIRKLWTGEWVTHEGQYYSVVDAKLYDVPAKPIPIYIAAAGPKSFHKAGYYGDGLITDAASVLDKQLRGEFEEGAQEAGKKPDQLPILVEQFVVVGDKSDAKKAADMWRFLPKAWDPYVDDPDPRSILRHAEEEVSDDEIMEKFFISDDPKEHADSIQELFDNGVTEVYVHSAQDQMEFIDFYGKQVLPLLRKS